MRGIVVRPVTEDNWADFVRLFETKGSPHYCWCTLYRLPAARSLANAEKKEHIRRLVGGGTPIGVLAYDRDEPIGWCSIGPRETYVRLQKSRTMPRTTPPTTSTWTILCFFVGKSQRERGVTHALIEGAVRYAKQQGAKIVEGYPFDTAGLSSTHRGHSRAFSAANFQLEGKRWWRPVQGRPK